MACSIENRAENQSKVLPLITLNGGKTRISDVGTTRGQSELTVCKVVIPLDFMGTSFCLQVEGNLLGIHS